MRRLTPRLLGSMLLLAGCFHYPQSIDGREQASYGGQHDAAVAEDASSLPDEERDAGKPLPSADAGESTTPADPPDPVEGEEDLDARCDQEPVARLTRDDVCWEAYRTDAPTEWTCLPDDPAPVTDVSLAACIEVCNGEYACRWDRTFHYDATTHTCLPTGSCELNGTPRFQFKPCVTSEDETWRWRRGPSTDSCDAVHPSWTRIDGVTLRECTDTCEAHEQCRRWRTPTYNESTQSCILDASCTPEDDGYFAHQYEPNVGCE